MSNKHKPILKLIIIKTNNESGNKLANKSYKLKKVIAFYIKMSLPEFKLRTSDSEDSTLTTR